MKNILPTIIIAALVAVLVGWMTGGDTSSGGKTESVYDRVMRKGTLKCGYLPSATFLDIDPNTGEKSGIVFDYMTQLTKNLGLKLEWAEEVGRGDYIPALAANRFDAYCTALTINAERAREVDFTSPYVFDRVGIYVRSDDDRFDFKLTDLNNKSVRFAVIEGDVFEKMIRKFFPDATIVTLPQLTPESEQFLQVHNKKADVVLSTPYISGRYIEKNPDHIRMVKLERPFSYGNIGISIKRGEYEFRRMIDLATMEMQANGQLDAILDKHDPQKLLGRRADPMILEGAPR